MTASRLLAQTPAEDEHGGDYQKHIQSYNEGVEDDELKIAGRKRRAQAAEAGMAVVEEGEEGEGERRRGERRVREEESGSGSESGEGGKKRRGQKTEESGARS